MTLVYGDHDWSRPAEREANRARLERAKIIVLKDTSHIASLESPEEFARILIETLSTARSAERFLASTEDEHVGLSHCRGGK